MHVKDLPSFKDMPPVAGMPHGTAWGLFDKNGERDDCGTLNLLTPENTLEASKEIKSGRSVALNWSQDRIHEPGFNRDSPNHTIRDLAEFGIKAYDDVISINTQSGSQWDGFRHWAHQATSLYYNNLPHSETSSPVPGTPCKNGIDAWTTRGGIVGRAVLIDYVAYAQRHNISYSPVTRHEISVETIEKIAKEQGVVFKEADILIVRSGFVKWYEEASTEERIRGAKNAHEFVGVKACEETVEWIWNQHFSAVAGDTVGFESWPPEANTGSVLHDWLLALFGCPIGELWNLEELAKVCAEQNRYSFFFTSAPLNFPGGVASPPNAVSIF
ncbi:hypothetical protein BELL_0014g00120 [Botrytis elliptica]|uniref:Cyclase n=1 Tax=Botrytis elliptica TaxID=278938 RepID=A0A4Z1K3L9_9HELO|nr:hypothetical protein EAE99_008415 [Botrytis elliptica]TGO80124.1 hypothetical protein BELL_0014g00120 [Botrytis elliptica]